MFACSPPAVRPSAMPERRGYHQHAVEPPPLLDGPRNPTLQQYSPVDVGAANIPPWIQAGQGASQNEMHSHSS